MHRGAVVRRLCVGRASISARYKRAIHRQKRLKRNRLQGFIHALQEGVLGGFREKHHFLDKLTEGYLTDPATRQIST
jgi:hypothetical protein